MLRCCAVCAFGRVRAGAALSIPARPSAAGWREAATWSVCSPQAGGHTVLRQKASGGARLWLKVGETLARRS